MYVALLQARVATAYFVLRLLEEKNKEDLKRKDGGQESSTENKLML